MPELPEVETTRRGVARHVVGRTISQIIVRQPKLRQPVSKRLSSSAQGAVIDEVVRRGKYLLFHTSRGTIIVHLGMSGSIRIVSSEVPAQKHDHLDIILDNQRCMRYRDPRRFGLVLWTTGDPLQHVLLRNLGPEPLTDQFDGEYLYGLSRGRRCAVKPLIMDAGVVVGVGNIYACEALFKAGIDPRRAAGRISLGRYQRLAAAIKSVLQQAIESGGTTLRDFTNGNGEPGYFRQQLQVYGQEDEPCSNCGNPVSRIEQAQRSTWYCRRCQC